MIIYCGSILAVKGTTKSDILGWDSYDEALAFKAAYEKLGLQVRMDREWEPEPQGSKADVVWRSEEKNKKWKYH